MRLVVKIGTSLVAPGGRIVELLLRVGNLSLEIGERPRRLLQFVELASDALAGASFTLSQAVLERAAGGPLAEGKHSVAVVAADVYQNQSAAFPLTFK